VTSLTSLTSLTGTMSYYGVKDKVNDTTLFATTVGGEITAKRKDYLQSNII
jgi:hypothetical protein